MINKYLWLTILVLNCFLQSFSTQASEAFKVIGYQASWADTIETIQYGKLTHINYSFVLPNADGSLKPIPQLSRLKKLLKLAHQHGVKVGLAIGGWNKGDDSNFEKLASHPRSRRTFIKAVMHLVQAHQLDGIDMDWEYPDQGTSAANFLSLIKGLSAELKKANKYLSAAVVAHGPKASGIKTEVFQYLDMLNIMAYDGIDHAKYDQALRSIKYWKSRSCPKSKLILGVPFYGREPYKAYKTLLQDDPNADKKDFIAKTRYNGVLSMQQKTRLAMAQCGGLMIWELSQDVQGDKSLLKAIDDVKKMSVHQGR